MQRRRCRCTPGCCGAWCLLEVRPLADPSSEAYTADCQLSTVNAMTSDILPAGATLDLVKEHSLTSALKTELERLIFDGKIRAGERINESTLAARFKTSRGPLREALQALGEQGLISFARNRGAFVRRLGLAEAEELYDLRAALDDEVGRKLAGRLTEEQAAS